jgi:hypothetical protein
MTLSHAQPEAAVGQSGGDHLGKYGTGSSPIINQPLSKILVDAGTGEILREGWSYEATLVERYALQSQARRSMLERWRRDGSEGRAHGVTRCRRWLRPRSASALGPVDPYAEVLKHSGTGKAFFAGTEICASPWACSVCSPKIQERRAEEIRSVVDQWAADGGICLFVTLTVPHGVDDVLSPMLGRFCLALERFRSGKRFAAINAALGRVGLIRAFEVTWGSLNGWHPHTHELWFVRPDDLRAWARGWLYRHLGYEPEWGEVLDRRVLEHAVHGALYDLWASAAVTAGLAEPSSAHGLDVCVAETQAELRAGLADYLAKLGRCSLPEGGRPLWGVADELVRAHSKRGRAACKMSPFDFLRAQFDQEISVAQKIHYRELFADYVQAFARKAQIFWSRGLKARFGIGEKTDGETAEESREFADVLARLDAGWWERLFVRADHRAAVLILAQEGGAALVREFMAKLPPFDFDTS